MSAEYKLRDLVSSIEHKINILKIMIAADKSELKKEEESELPSRWSLGYLKGKISARETEAEALEFILSEYKGDK